MWRTLLSLLFVVGAMPPALAGTLEDIRSGGILQCGVDDVLKGYSAQRMDGQLVGLAPGFCRALAVAIFGDAAKVNFSILKPEERIEALQSGEIDILLAAIPVSAAVEMRDGLMFADPLFFAKTREAYAPLVRQGDDGWLVAVRWVRHVWVGGKTMTIDAETGFVPDWQSKVHEAGGYAETYQLSFGVKPIAPNVPTSEGGWLWVPSP
jgi:ABC-type amino acid transport substrate-binding protein